MINGKWQYGITIRIPPDEDILVEPCGLIPSAGLPFFWAALEVQDGYEEQWLKGNWVAAAPKYPILSELIQMTLDTSEIQATDTPALLEELRVGRVKCEAPDGLAIFDVLERCARIAASQSKGLMLSPMG